MKQSRLRWLLIFMVVLAIARVLLPAPSREAPAPVAEAIVRKAAPKTSAPTTELPLQKTTRMSTDQEDVPGDAFAVRPPPAPPYVPPAPVIVAKAKPMPAVPVLVAPPLPAEPPMPPMPYQVIGTWDDGKEPGVFLSSPYGAVLARPGAMLQSEYRVTSITPQQISLLHIASKREVRLAISRPPLTPPAYP